MRAFMGLAFAGLILAAPTGASAQATTDPAIKAIDRAGETAATKGAPGTLVPDTPGSAVAPGIESPVAVPAAPPSPPREPTPAAK